MKDEQWGERPKAFVTVREGKQITGQEVVAWARDNKSISRFMVPREVEVLSDLPKTSTGKIKKTVLRKWAEGSSVGSEE